MSTIINQFLSIDFDLMVCAYRIFNLTRCWQLRSKVKAAKTTPMTSPWRSAWRDSLNQNHSLRKTLGKPAHCKDVDHIPADFSFITGRMQYAYTVDREIFAVKNFLSMTFSDEN